MDLTIYMTENGGEIPIVGNDVATTHSIYLQPLLAMFGGNVEQSHGDEEEFQLVNERFDYWGNALIGSENIDEQFNSETERALQNIPLTSQGLAEISALVKADLEFLRQVGTVSISVELIGHEHVEITVLIREPEGIARQEFIFIWDGTKLEQILTGLKDFENIPPNLLLIGDEGQQLLTDDGLNLFAD